jgi:hypothetical protein
MVSDNVYRKGRAFQVVLPTFEHLKYCQKLLIVHIIVEFSTGKRSGMKCDRVKFTGCIELQQDSTEGIVRGVGSHDQRLVGNPMRQNRGRSESLLEKPEGLSAIFSKSPWDTFPGKPSEGNRYVQVVVNETTVEIGEPEEGLYILDSLGFGPIPYRLDFIFGHRKSVGQEHIAKELHRISVPFCQGTTPSPLPPTSPVRTPVPIPELHLPVPNSDPPPHLVCSSEVGTASDAKRVTWYAVSRYRGIKARIAGEYRAMALAAVKGVYSTGSLAVGILRLFSLDFPSAR